VIARVGDFEVRLLELPSGNSSEELILWVELYDRDLRVGVDSCKCSDLDEAIDAAQFLTAQARQQSRGMSGILLRAITGESMAARVWRDRVGLLGSSRSADCARERVRSLPHEAA
jgi:hypothetical protein